MSEDPYLSGRLAAAYIAGVQHTGQVGATAKHFAINNQESHRFVVNAVVDERTARELYLRHFEHLVVKNNNTSSNNNNNNNNKEKTQDDKDGDDDSRNNSSNNINDDASASQPAAIMCAYNKVNGVYCSEHVTLMTDILRNEWKYSGIVMTDWGATSDRSAGIRAGIDLEMPGSHGVHRAAIEEDLKTGALSLSNDLDAACLRMMQLIQTYASSVEPTNEQAMEKYPVDWKAHYELAYQAAMECVVLLRNENNFLPIKLQTSVALIGDFARAHPRYQGMGSSQVCSQKVVTAYDEVKRHTDTIFFAPGYCADDDHPELVDQALVDEAVETAKKAQTVILCIGLPEIMESEGFDREHLSLPAQHKALVEAISQVNPHIVVVLSNGGVVEIPWFDKVQAIMEGYLLGEAGGAAVVDLIFGIQSPCGKLAETFPERIEDVPADQYFPGSQSTVEYREGLDVGYRYFDTAQKPVRYPFGHGLSYSRFKYDDLCIDLVEEEPNKVLVNVQFRLTNTGTWHAKEIVQCYVHDKESSVYRPIHELKGFCKVLLQPGESQDVELQLTQDAFSFYDIGINDWVIEKGSFEIRIGSSSRDIRLKGLLTLEYGGIEKASEMATISYPAIQDSSKVCPMDDQTFFKRFGNSTAFPLKLDDDNDEDVESEGSDSSSTRGQKLALFHRNSLLKEIANKRIIGMLLMYIVYCAASWDIAKGPKRKRQKRMVRAAVENLPLRTIVLFSKGNMTFHVLDGLISLMNFHFIDAAARFGRAFLQIFRRKDT